jgi:hypothetical protein
LEVLGRVTRSMAQSASPRLKRSPEPWRTSPGRSEPWPSTARSRTFPPNYPSARARGRAGRQRAPRRAKRPGDRRPGRPDPLDDGGHREGDRYGLPRGARRARAGGCQLAPRACRRPEEPRSFAGAAIVDDTDAPSAISRPTNRCFACLGRRGSERPARKRASASARIPDTV